MRIIYLIIFLFMTFPVQAAVANYAVVDGSGNIINMVLWDGVSTFPAPAGDALVLATGTPAYIGGTYNGSSFSSPPVVPPPSFTNPTLSGCSATSIALVPNTGNQVIMGSFTAGVSTTCTVLITANTVAANVVHGWNCTATDLTTPKNLINQIIPFSTSTMTISGSTTSGDVINLLCAGF